MKKILIFFFYFFLINKSLADIKLSYIDIDFIIKNSIAGKSSLNKLNELRKEESEEIEELEKNLNLKKDELLSQKNIISEEIFNQEAKKLKDEFDKFKINKNKKINNIKKSEKEYTNLFLKKLNPIITDYVEENKISVLIPKRNIIIGKKELDITDKILVIFDDQIKSLEP